MPSSRTIPVACAVLENPAGRLLLAQRPAQKNLAFKWEFPGGKVEEGEAASTALIRELREELGCDGEIVRPLPSFTHDYITFRIEMFPFVCRLAENSAAPEAREHLEIRWVQPSEIAAYDLAPADWPVLESYSKREAPIG